MERKRRLGLQMEVSEGWYDSLDGTAGTSSWEECVEQQDPARKTSSQNLGVEVTVRKLRVRRNLSVPALRGFLLDCLLLSPNWHFEIETLMTTR